MYNELKYNNIAGVIDKFPVKSYIKGWEEKQMSLLTIRSLSRDSFNIFKTWYCLILKSYYKMRCVFELIA